MQRKILTILLWRASLQAEVISSNVLPISKKWVYLRTRKFLRNYRIGLMKRTQTNRYRFIVVCTFSFAWFALVRCNPRTSLVTMPSQGPDYGAGKLDARCLVYHRNADTSDFYFKIDVLELIPQSKVFSGEELNLTTCIKWKASNVRDSLCKEFHLDVLNGFLAFLRV